MIVNKFSGETTPPIGGETSANGGSPDRPKKPVLKLHHAMKHPPIEVPGIEVMGAAPEGARAVAGPFYADENELLVRMLKDLKDRDRHCVAPSPDSGDVEKLSIYRKP